MAFDGAPIDVVNLMTQGKLENYSSNSCNLSTK